MTFACVYHEKKRNINKVRSTEVPVDGALQAAFLVPRILIASLKHLVAVSPGGVSGYLFFFESFDGKLLLLHGKDIKQQISWQFDNLGKHPPFFRIHHS